MRYLYATFETFISSDSLLITIKMKAKKCFRAAAMFCFYILQKNCPSKISQLSKIYYDASLEEPKLNYAKVISVT